MKKLILLSSLLCLHSFLFAQGVNVKGTVKDDTGEGLPGVNVIVKETTSGGITDIDGNYSVTVEDKNASLIFSSVGYVTEEVVIGDRSVIDITLTPDVTALDEIVVVGYGTQQKRDLTGSIVSVDMTGKTIAPNTSFAQALQGYMPGVNVGIVLGSLLKTLWHHLLDEKGRLIDHPSFHHRKIIVGWHSKR
jgi:hypothetical protein